MSGGYTPLFGGIVRGSLHGKWPDIGVWMLLLAMADRNGVIDYHPSAIAAAAGLPEPEICGCIERFCAPDPMSRNPVNEGRRLEPLPGRGFGWRVINHGDYREKARKAAYDSARTASGVDAARKRESRAEQEDLPWVPPVPTRPDASREVPPSDSNTNTNTDPSPSEKDLETCAPLGRPPVFEDWLMLLQDAYPKRAGSQNWPGAVKAIHARLREGVGWQGIIAGANRYRGYCKATGKVGTEFVMMASTFVGTSRYFTEPWEPPPSRSETRTAANVSAAQEFMRRTDGDSTLKGNST